MQQIDYKQFKSGTDIRGIAVDTEKNKINLTDEAVAAMAGGFACWLCNHLDKAPEELTVTLGHDSRISADRICRVVTAALNGCGINVKKCGLSSTPAMFMSTVDGGADAAVQITASHHPFDRNGLKFFTKQGGLESEDISEILEYAERELTPACEKKGEVTDFDYMPRYAEILRQKICEALGAEQEAKPLSGFAFAVDAGNGAGGFYAKDVLERLGADVSGSRYLEPDGMFPNHVPNPEDKTAMAAITEATVQSGADLGIIFDTDVDRAGCVDKNGNEINRNPLIALAAAIALEGNEGGTIVTDSVTSAGLKSFINDDLGGVHHRFKRGYKNVINEAVRLNNEGINSPLAIETSGHAALRENYFLDDGAYLITKIIIKLVQLKREGKELSDLIGGLALPAEEDEARLAIEVPQFKAYGTLVLADLEMYAKQTDDFEIADDNREGVRVICDGGKSWFLLRMSVHDPIMPMNIESDIEGGCKAIAQRLVTFFEQYDKLDISPLKRIAEN